jgi:hypothetical protein
VTQTLPNAASVSAAPTVTRHWPTGVVIAEIDLAGIVAADAPSQNVSGPPLQLLDIDEAVADEAALTAEFLASMNALAQAAGTNPVERIELEVQVWRTGYDQPATSYAADWISWCFLATSPTPQHSESGAIALADPRAGSALTAMPGLPWGRQMMIRPTPGAHATAPGWLTCSVVPVEEEQFAVVAVASSR